MKEESDMTIRNDRGNALEQPGTSHDQTVCKVGTGGKSRRRAIQGNPRLVAPWVVNPRRVFPRTRTQVSQLPSLLLSDNGGLQHQLGKGKTRKKEKKEKTSKS